GNIGDRIALSAILNPVSRHDQKATTVPIGQTTEWLTPRLRGAVDLEHVEVEDLGCRRGWRGGRMITIAWRAITATAVITDPSMLETLISDGVGRAKGYGCGLLMVSGVES